MLSNQSLSEKSVNLKNLSLQEKLILVQDIWDEISCSQENVAITNEQKIELNLRLSNYQLKPEEGRSWNLVKEDIKSKL